MNAASQNFQLHLGVLRDRTLHAADFGLAVNYFLDEFACDTEFIRASDREDAPHLVAVLNLGVSKSLGRLVELEDVVVSYLREHRFFHGHAKADGHVVVYFYFQDADMGIAMLMPGVRGEMDIARFRLIGGLPDPRMN